MSEAAFKRLEPIASACVEFRAWPQPSVVDDSMTSPEVDEYARGLEDGQRLAETRFDVERQQLLQLLASAEALQPVNVDRARGLMLQNVERLVSEIVGGMPVDRDWLIAEIDQVLRLAGEIDGERILWLNPKDIELVNAMDCVVTLRPDNFMVRGSMRLEIDGGWIEHGRIVKLDELRGRLGEQGCDK